jgi:DNA-binding transcriptional LysR family regulator
MHDVLELGMTSHRFWVLSEKSDRAYNISQRRVQPELGGPANSPRNRLRGGGDCPEDRPMIARKYLYLIALAKEKHFGRAAAACHVSSSTLSAAIRDLEAELGVAVVERGQHFTALTPEGQCVLDYAQRMAGLAQSLKQDLAKLRGGLSGQLRLGVIPTALTAVADLTASFCRRHPLVTIEVKSLSTQEILARLRRFELDAGIDMVFQPLWQEDHVLVTARGGLLDGRSEISWAEAAQLPLCLLTPDMQNRKIIDQIFASLGHKVAPQIEANSILSILAHVSAGGWSSILPHRVLELVGTPEGVKALDLVQPSVGWETGLLTLERPTLPPMVAALREEADALRGLSGKDE